MAMLYFLTDNFISHRGTEAQSIADVCHRGTIIPSFEIAISRLGMAVSRLGTIISRLEMKVSLTERINCFYLHDYMTCWHWAKNNIGLSDCPIYKGWKGRERAEKQKAENRVILCFLL